MKAKHAGVHMTTNMKLTRKGFYGQLSACDRTASVAQRTFVHWATFTTIHHVSSYVSSAWLPSPAFFTSLSRCNQPEAIIVSCGNRSMRWAAMCANPHSLISLSRKNGEIFKINEEDERF